MRTKKLNVRLPDEYFDMSVFILAMQVAYFLSFRYDIAAYRDNCHFIWDPSILWWQGNDQYFQLMIAIIGLGSLLLILRMLMPGKNDRQKKAAKRHMTKEERMQYSHLASRHEVKKGLQRLRYDSNGDVVHHSFSKAEVIIGQVLTVSILSSLAWSVTEVAKGLAAFIGSHAESCRWADVYECRICEQRTVFQSALDEH